MLEWAKKNARPIATVTFMIVLWVLSQFPQMASLQSLIYQIGLVLGILGTSFVPNFQPPQDKKD